MGGKAKPVSSSRQIHYSKRISLLFSAIFILLVFGYAGVVLFCKGIIRLSRNSLHFLSL